MLAVGLVPPVLASHLLALSRFDAPNGTSLDAYTPEVGAAWAELVGDMSIQSGQAVASVTSMSVVDAGESDCVVMATCTPQKVNAGNYANVILCVRLSDTDNRWQVVPNIANNTLQLYEVNAGSSTLRGSSAVPISSGVPIVLLAVCSGSTITAYLDGGNKISYASATFNQTAEKFGIRDYVVGSPSAPAFDEFSITRLQ